MFEFSGIMIVKNEDGYYQELDVKKKEIKF